MKMRLCKKYKLSDLPNGSLFLYDGTIALKSEYRSDGKSDAYIVGSGEYFWGGTNDKEIRESLKVFRLKIT